MKKYGVLILAALLAMLCAACTAAPQSELQVVPVSLTQDQQRLLKLMDGKLEFALFTIDAKTPPSGLTLWVECYEKGVRTEDAARLAVSGIPDHPELFYDGIAVIYDHQDSPLKWTLVNYKEDSGMASGTGREIVFDSTGMASGHGGTFNQPVTVREGEDILLYTALFTGGGAIYTGRLTEAAENPELLRPYDLAFLVKCRLGELE